MSKPFFFKKFNVDHNQCAMKVGTDGVLLGAWTTSTGQRILDIGTGCGLIALILAQRNAGALIDAVEIDEPSAIQAKSNFDNSPWGGRLKAICNDIKNFDPGFYYDLIISNPPYFTDSTPSPDIRKHQVRHNSLLSLSELLRQVKRLLSDDGKFSVILPVVEGEFLIKEAASSELFTERIAGFIPRPGKATERLLITFSRSAGEIFKENILHYNNENEWSEQYKDLTRDFYTIL